MNMLTATKSVLGKNYLKFSGRASRSEYWYWALVRFLLVVLIYLYLFFVSVPTGTLMLVLFQLFCFLPDLAVQFRRMQDCNINGLWFLLIYVPSLAINVFNWKLTLERQAGNSSLVE